MNSVYKAQQTGTLRSECRHACIMYNTDHMQFIPECHTYYIKNTKKQTKKKRINTHHPEIWIISYSSPLKKNDMPFWNTLHNAQAAFFFNQQYLLVVIQQINNNFNVQLIILLSYFWFYGTCGVDFTFGYNNIVLLYGTFFFIKSSVPRR